MWVHLDYLWVGGNDSPRLRSKTKIVRMGETEDGQPELALEPWNFDGSSTSQATTEDSERILQPVKLYRLSENHFVCLCEVFYPQAGDDEWAPHESNHRYKLRQLLQDSTEDVWVGFEQEYFLTQEGSSIVLKSLQKILIKK